MNHLRTKWACSVLSILQCCIWRVTFRLNMLHLKQQQKSWMLTNLPCSPSMLWIWYHSQLLKTWSKNVNTCFSNSQYHNICISLHFWLNWTCLWDCFYCFDVKNTFGIKIAHCTLPERLNNWAAAQTIFFFKKFFFFFGLDTAKNARVCVWARHLGTLCKIYSDKKTIIQL